MTVAPRSLSAMGCGYGSGYGSGCGFGGAATGALGKGRAESLGLCSEWVNR